VDNKANGTITATNFPPSCMQQFSNSSTIYTTYETQFLVNGGNSEYCYTCQFGLLRLKSSLNSNAHCRCSYKHWVVDSPVVDRIRCIKFRTNGYSARRHTSSWSSSESTYHLEQNKRLSLSSSYRVNVFGFPNAKSLTDQNLGLLDQRKALVLRPEYSSQ
jgi:hypothetical protein